MVSFLLKHGFVGSVKFKKIGAYLFIRIKATASLAFVLPQYTSHVQNNNSKILLKQNRNV